MGFLQQLGIAYPIFQAPMAGIATPELAATVSNAGGLGALGVASVDNPTALEMIRATQRQTTRPFNVNVFCHQPPSRQPLREAQWLNFLAPLFEQLDAPLPQELHDRYPSFRTNPGLLDVLLLTRPRVVSFHFGLPTPQQLALIHGAGIFTLATATNTHEAQLIAQAGIQGIVVQGNQAGGHRGIFDPTAHDPAQPTLELLKAIRAQTQLPLVAAGGIMTGAHIQQALALGANAAQLGTAFVATNESAAGPRYRALMKDRSRRTQLSSAISGRPARGIINDYINYTNAPQAPQPAAYPLAYDATKGLQQAAQNYSKQHGNPNADPIQPNAPVFDCGAYWAGENVHLARHLPARQLVQLLLRELAQAQTGA